MVLVANEIVMKLFYVTDKQIYSKNSKCFTSKLLELVVNVICLCVSTLYSNTIKIERNYSFHLKPHYS